MKVVIVGGGISGLAAAFSLLKADPEADLTILESASRIGGVISTRYEDDCVIEEGPDSFLTSKPWAVSLCDQLGVADQLIATNDANRRAFIATNGRLQPLPEGFVMLAPTKIWPFIDTPILSLRGKMAAALELLRAPVQPSEDETLKDFIVRRFGDELFERIAQPMVGGIYTGDPEKLSAAATVPQFVEMEQKYGSVTRGLLNNGRINSKDSGPRYSAFVTMNLGLQALVEALGDKIGRDKIRLNSGLQRISHSADRWQLVTHSGHSHEADVVVLAAPAKKVGEMISSLDSSLSAHLSSVEHTSSVILNLLFEKKDINHPLDGFGFVVPERERKSIIACSFSSTKFKGRAPSNQVLMRVFLGGALHPDVFALSDGDLIKVALEDLRTYLGITSYPLKIWLKRWPNAMPQYHVGHLELVQQIKHRFTSHRGLIWAGSALCGVGIPDCIRGGLEAAQSVSAFQRESGTDE
jgi:oxygen-dependent protoporphyrinogen oxidase